MNSRAIALKYLKTLTAETQSTQSKGKVNVTLMYYGPVNKLIIVPVSLRTLRLCGKIS